VVPRDAAGDDMLVLLDSGEAISLGLIDSTGRTLRWQTAPLSKDGRQSVVALGADMVYLADQTRLEGLRLVDGKPAWQARLDVELPSGCDDCLLVLEKRVVALRKDHTLQAFDTQTGQPVWSTRLDEMPRHVPVVGHQLVVVQNSEGQSDPQILLIDAADGKVARQIAPTCARGEPNDQTASLTPSSPLLPSPDGAALFVVLRWSDTCMQRWDPDANAPAWQVWLDSDLLPSSWDAHNVLLTDRRMFIANDHVLSVLDTTTGALTTLVRDKEYQLTPLFARDNIVVVKATPDWDRNRHSLWALDAATGERRWQYAIQAKEWFGDSGFNEWGAQLTPSGVAVVQVPGDSHELIVERLDLQSGASLGRQAIALGGTGSTTVWENRWTDRMAWLEVDTSLYTVDLVSGEIVAQER
jgi:outer membrane protein assembly factor BamB